VAVPARHWPTRDGLPQGREQRGGVQSGRARRIQRHLVRIQDTYDHSLIVTESDQAGLGHAAYRTVSDEALDQVARGIESARLGRGWIDADIGHGRAYRFETPDGHIGEVLWEHG